MTDSSGPDDTLEVEPELILRELARVLAAAVPGLSLTPSLGDPQPISTLFDDDELRGAGAALLAENQQIRSLGMGIALNGDWWMGLEITGSDVTPERWVGFAEQLLSHIQDVISQATTNPWPEVRLDGRRTHAPVGAALEGRFLRMWFGDREDPVMMFEPIEIMKGAREQAG